LSGCEQQTTRKNSKKNEDPGPNVHVIYHPASGMSPMQVYP
jgi:hypothetical protein